MYSCELICQTLEQNYTVWHFLWHKLTVVGLSCAYSHSSKSIIGTLMTAILGSSGDRSSGLQPYTASKVSISTHSKFMANSHHISSSSCASSSWMLWLHVRNLATKVASITESKQVSICSLTSEASVGTFSVVAKSHLSCLILVSSLLRSSGTYLITFLLYSRTDWSDARTCAPPDPWPPGTPPANCNWSFDSSYPIRFALPQVCTSAQTLYASTLHILDQCLFNTCAMSLRNVLRSFPAWDLHPFCSGFPTTKYASTQLPSRPVCVLVTILRYTDAIRTVGMVGIGLVCCVCPASLIMVYFYAVHHIHTRIQLHQSKSTLWVRERPRKKTTNKDPDRIRPSRQSRHLFQNIPSMTHTPYTKYIIKFSKLHTHWFQTILPYI